MQARGAALFAVDFRRAVLCMFKRGAGVLAMMTDSSRGKLFMADSSAFGQRGRGAHHAAPRQGRAFSRSRRRGVVKRQPGRVLLAGHAGWVVKYYNRARRAVVYHIYKAGYARMHKGGVV